MEALTLTVLTWFYTLLALVALGLLVAGVGFGIFCGARSFLYWLEEYTPERPTDYYRCVERELEQWQQAEPSNQLPQQLLTILGHYRPYRDNRQQMRRVS